MRDGLFKDGGEELTTVGFVASILALMETEVVLGVRVGGVGGFRSS